MFKKIKDFEVKILAHEDRREELYEQIDGLKDKIKDICIIALSLVVMTFCITKTIEDS